MTKECHGNNLKIVKIISEKKQKGLARMDKVQEAFKRMREDAKKNAEVKKKRNKVFNEILKEQIHPDRFEKPDEMDSEEDAERNRDQE